MLCLPLHRHLDVDLRFDNLSAEEERNERSAAREFKDEASDDFKRGLNARQTFSFLNSIAS